MQMRLITLSSSFISLFLPSIVLAASITCQSELKCDDGSCDKLKDGWTLAQTDTSKIKKGTYALRDAGFATYGKTATGFCNYLNKATETVLSVTQSVDKLPSIATKSWKYEGGSWKCTKPTAAECVYEKIN